MMESSNRHSPSFKIRMKTRKAKKKSLRSLVVGDLLVEEALSTAADQSCAEDSSSFVSYWTLSFLNPLFDKGMCGTLEHADLGPASNQDQAKVLYEKLDIHLHQELQKPERKRSLWLALFRTVGYKKLFDGIFLYALASAASFGPVLILDTLVQHFEGNSHLSTIMLGVLIALIFVLPVLNSLLTAHSNVLMGHIAVQFRNALIDMIYRKSLRLSPTARQQASTGQIMNMFSNDTNQIQLFVVTINMLALVLPTIAVSFYLVYMQIGLATLIGVALLIAVVPLNILLFSWMNKVRKEKVCVTDSRVKLMNEVLNGIRIIKYYAWEKAFQNKIVDIRKKELVVLKKLSYISAVGLTVLLQAVPIIQPVCIFFVYVALGNALNAAKSFTVISLFFIMQTPFFIFPTGLAQYAQASVSMNRILTFLASDELEAYVDTAVDTAQAMDVVVAMESAMLCWDDPELSKVVSSQSTVKKEVTNLSTSSKSSKVKIYAETITKTEDEQETEYNELEEGNRRLMTPSVMMYTLTNMNFQIQKGQLVAVVGTTGSGKSSLLNGLLGEMHLKGGKVRVAGSVAYCDQRCWIVNDTVKGNILFGLPYDEAKFDRAMYASNLQDRAQ